jgi:hypothetical protein
MENLLLENGDKLLLENGNGIFLESYVPPEDFLTADIEVGDAVVSTTLRVNTPKEWTVDMEMSDPVVTLNPVGMISSDPNKVWGAVDIVVGEVQMTTSNISATTPRHYRPPNHYVWVYDVHGNKVNVIT